MKNIIFQLLLISIGNTEVVSNQYTYYTLSTGCLDELFFLENIYYQPRKVEYKIKSPAYFLKNNIELYDLGEEIYEALNESQYEYMFHAIHLKFGVEVYRICPKNSDYTKYGKIESHLGKGYRMRIPHILSMDIYFWQENYDLYSNRKKEIKNYIQIQKKLKNEEFIKNNPITATIYEIVKNLLLTGIYLIMSSPFIFMFYNMLYS